MNIGILSQIDLIIFYKAQDLKYVVGFCRWVAVSLLQRQPTPLEKFVGHENDRLLLSVFDRGCSFTYAGRKRVRGM